MFTQDSHVKWEMMKYSVNIFVENVKNTPHLNQEQFSSNYPLIEKSALYIDYVCLYCYLHGWRRVWLCLSVCFPSTTNTWGSDLDQHLKYRLRLSKNRLGTLRPSVAGHLQVSILACTHLSWQTNRSHVDKKKTQSHRIRTALSVTAWVLHGVVCLNCSHMYRWACL